jgi:hypothetical protein
MAVGKEGEGSVTAPFLPYRCLPFRTDHLLEPCRKNLERVKALKAAKKRIGPLERCVECKGKMLEKREEPGYVSPERKGWDPVPEVTTEPLFLNEVGKKPSKKEEIAPELPKSADISGMAPDFTGGLSTEEYVREIRGSVEPPKEEETVQEVAKEVDIGPGKQEAIARGIRPPETVEPRYCPAHPEVLQRQDSLGRYMGVCQECLVARGRKTGIENTRRGVSAPPMSIPLNLPKYAGLKEWLIVQAYLNDRTLQKEIMMVLKTAWRQGT